jgi:glycosyltransferase involved in cell wall biosynthesis
MRTLIHLTASQYGGVETHVYYLSQALAAAGAQVTLVSQRKFDLNAEWAKSLRDINVCIVPPPQIVKKLPGSMGLILSRLSLTCRLRGQQFDRVVGQGHGGAYAWMKRFVKPGGLFLWHEYWYGVPTHGDDYGDDFVAPALARLSPRMMNMIKRLDGIVTGCQRAQRNLRQVQGLLLPIRVIPPLTKIDVQPDAAEKSYKQSSTIKIGMIARHGFGKGSAMLLQIWSELNIGNAELHLLGPVSNGRFAEVVSRYHSDPTIHIRGPFQREELPQLVTELDLGLFLSIEDGYGLVPLEYMACGVPFVMTDVGAADEFTQNNSDALKVAVSHADVKAGIEEMVRRLRVGDTSRQRIQRFYQQRFSFEQVKEQHVASLLGPESFWSTLE